MKTVVIDTKDLKHNIEKIKKHSQINEPDDSGNPVKIIAVVKANAYGLDIIKYTKFLIDNGINFFAVATKEEAVELRKEGIKQDILMLSPTAIEKDVKELIEKNIIITISSREDIEVAEKIAGELKKKVRAHLKIDTGFGRYGFIYNRMDNIVREVSKIKNIKIEGTFSHFSISYYDDKYTKKQFDRFINVIEVLKMNDIETGMLHICNSSAFIKFPNMHLNAVRVGSAFLGRLSCKQNIGLKRIGIYETNISEIKTIEKGEFIGYSNTYKTKKETKIAIIPTGYIDGINIRTGEDMFRNIDKIRNVVRAVKNLTKKQALYVKIKGKDCRILGMIGTYHIIADITDLDVNIGEKAIFNINPQFIDKNIEREYR